MARKGFELNEDTLSVIEEIGGHMPGGFFIYRADAPEKLVYANKAVFDIFGCEDLEDFKNYTGYTFKGMVYEEDYNSISASIIEQIKDDDDDQMDYVEYRIVRKDGRIRWVDDYGHYTETKAYGGVYVVFISDITEKRELREEGTAVKDAVISTLTTAYNTVWLINDVVTEKCSLYHTDQDLAHAVAIRNALSHAKYTDTKTEYVNTMVAEEDRERMQEEIGLPYILKQFETRDSFSVMFRRALKSGPRYYRIDFGRVYMPGGRTGVTMGFIDIDVQVQEQMAAHKTLTDALALAEEANKAKTAFLSNMSHEMRTPMNAIIGLDSLALKNKNLPEETREYLEKIGESARHLLGLINNILDMSRTEAGRVVLNKEEFSFRNMLEQLNALVSSQCQGKGLQYECRIGGGISEYYVGDELKLKQVLTNILSNAVKFTDAPGSVTLKVEQTAGYKDHSTLRFSVKDTGIGMDKEFLPKIFDAFSQEETGRGNKYGSTGLGMAITANIVRMMNGTITVESEKGVGSEFTVILTLTNSVRKNNELLSEEKQRSDLKGKRILMAEDILINAEIVKQIIESREAVVDHAENGRITVGTFQKSEPGYYDAVLMDVRMPEMDGLQAASAIRALNRPDAKTVPIIALTANAFDEDVQRSLQAGMNAHLSKPVEPDRLFQTLEELIWENEHRT